MKGISLLPGCYLDNAGRNRCEKDDKVAYETLEAAAAAVQQRRSYTRQQLRTYRGECGYWHMTSNKGDPT